MQIRIQEEETKQINWDFHSEKFLKISYIILYSIETCKKFIILLFYNFFFFWHSLPVHGRKGPNKLEQYRKRKRKSLGNMYSSLCFFRVAVNKEK